ncbi:hypothetical protein FIU87_13635 [Bacillus sp. THAF10]|uniref:hypothetical protein n=1 Tax=Bacillus sp. THAF10 TaxID=2587848 RepID=UPI0012681B4C|nr:hypothetical protein [Bacillus sp. THAF10]QFT89698.1 hypothetical protein FIU87_13635 [Bacillus sp. THAF10]
MLKKFIFTGVLLAIVSWAGNMYYYNSQQLERPIMMKHYYELPKEHIDFFRLHYITNKVEQMDIAWVEFPELGEHHLAISSDQSHDQGNYYQSHKIKTLHLTTYHDSLPKQKEDIILTKMTAHFTNGDSHTYEIGEIVFKESNRGPFQFRGSGGSSDGTGYDNMSSSEMGLEVTDVTIRGHERLGNFSLTINKQEFEPKSKENGITTMKLQGKEEALPIRFLNVKHAFSFESDDPNRFHFYSIIPIINGLKENGEPFKQDFHANYEPYFSEKELKQYMKAAKENN